MATTSDKRARWDSGDGLFEAIEDDAGLFGSGTIAARPGTGDADGDFYTVLDQADQIFRIDCWSSTNAAWMVALHKTTSDPGVSDDQVAGYFIGTIWVNTSANTVSICVDATPSLAVWVSAAAADTEPGYAHGAKLTYSSVTTVTIGTSGETSFVRDSTDTEDIGWTGTLTAALTVSGAGGLDTGTEAADTWYAVHAIGDSTAVNTPDALLSLSATAPTLPTGYDKFRRLGWVRNNGSSNLLDFEQRGNGGTRRIYWDENRCVLTGLTDGSATVFAAIDCSSFVPPTSTHIVLQVEFAVGGGGAASHALRIRPTGSTMAFRPIMFAIGVVSGVKALGQLETPCNDSQSIDYRVATAANDATIRIVAWDDEL